MVWRGEWVETRAESGSTLGGRLFGATVGWRESGRSEASTASVIVFSSSADSSSPDGVVVVENRRGFGILKHREPDFILDFVIIVCFEAVWVAVVECESSLVDLFFFVVGPLVVFFTPRD